MRIVVPRDARDHGYLALKVDGGGRGFGRSGSGAAGSARSGWDGAGGLGRGCFGLGRGWFGGGARGDGELLGLLVLGGMLVLRLVFGRVVFRGRRPASGGLLLVGQPVLGG